MSKMWYSMGRGVREVGGGPGLPDQTADKLTSQQIANRTSWSMVPDIDMTRAALHVIHTRPHGLTTVTTMNTLDPATVDEGAGENRGWLESPKDYGPNAIHGRAWR